MADWNNPFRVNVGFITAEAAGYSREILFDVPRFPQEPDLEPVHGLKDISGSMIFTRTSEGVLVQAQLTASLPAECVRCLEPFTLKITTQFNELYVFLAHVVRETELILPPTGILDLTPIVREYFLLEIPIKLLCSSDCQGLCPVCGEKLNDNHIEHQDDDIDSRLDNLINLLDQ